MPVAWASSAGVGARPPPCWAIARFTRTAASFRSRGTWIAQPRSRKWRFSSPRIVGTAKVGEADAARGVEAVDRVHEPQRGDLEEVVERFAAVAVAQREVSCETEVALHHRVALGAPEALGRFRTCCGGGLHAPPCGIDWRAIVLASDLFVGHGPFLLPACLPWSAGGLGRRFLHAQRARRACHDRSVRGCGCAVLARRRSP